MNRAFLFVLLTLNACDSLPGPNLAGPTHDAAAEAAANPPAMPPSPPAPVVLPAEPTFIEHESPHYVRRLDDRSPNPARANNWSAFRPPSPEHPWGTLLFAQSRRLDTDPEGRSKTETRPFEWDPSSNKVLRRGEPAVDSRFVGDAGDWVLVVPDRAVVVGGSSTHDSDETWLHLYDLELRRQRSLRLGRGMFLELAHRGNEVIARYDNVDLYPVEARVNLATGRVVSQYIVGERFAERGSRELVATHPETGAEVRPRSGDFKPGTLGTDWRWSFPGVRRPDDCRDGLKLGPRWRAAFHGPGRVFVTVSCAGAGNSWLWMLETDSFVPTK